MRDEHGVDPAGGRPGTQAGSRATDLVDVIAICSMDGGGPGIVGRVALRGDLDATTAIQVHHILEGLVEDEAWTSLELVLASVRFLDSSGVRVLLQVDEWLQGRGGRLRLVNPSRPVSRVLRVTGLLEHLTGEPSTR